MAGFSFRTSGWIDCFRPLPLLVCCTFDISGLRFINIFWLFGHGFIGLEIAVLMLALTFGARLGVWNGPVAGALFAGALFAGGLGLNS
jgi:hypothetical protein